MRKMLIGSRNVSSWSLRPWLAARQAGIVFEEVCIRLDQPGAKEAIRQHSPSGKVPCLIDESREAPAVLVWDSLAICEYLAELAPGLWPANVARRAEARAVSAEMHSGFSALRSQMSMNIAASKPGEGRTAESQADIERIVAIWESCRSRHAAHGAFLFGDFSIADAMYAPVVWRFRTYAVALPPAAQAWADAMLDLPAMREWQAAALAEVS